ncbi:MAG: tetraacyldisaccharide 4'-kinase [Candidatus Poribacteria bacterium]|nr:tetraacyldisaccharide 4'-kinase [Candidatus Poribacteria bacterium]
MRRIPSRDLASLQQKLLATPLRFLLIPLSWLYGASVWIRNRLYTLGLFKARTLPCRVISVGNIVVGGTGKTPAVITIASHLQKQGKRVAILLRGYKRQSREKVTIVSDGKRVCASLGESGDEAYMMATHLSGIPIVVSSQRYQAGRVALECFEVDVLLLDDGFQHRQLARDIDILTVRTERPFGDSVKLLPAGTLREPPTALQRADIILLTRTEAANISLHAKEIVKRFTPNALILESVHQPVYLYPLAGNKSRKKTNILDTAKALEGKRILAVCGIGNPDALVTTLMRCSPENVKLLAFPDHHVYTEADLGQMDRAFQAAQADMIVTTQKDEGKLEPFVVDWELPIFVLEVALVITEGVEKLTEVLLSDL